MARRFPIETPPGLGDGSSRRGGGAAAGRVGAFLQAPKACEVPGPQERGVDAFGLHADQQKILLLFPVITAAKVEESVRAGNPAER